MSAKESNYLSPDLPTVPAPDVPGESVSTGEPLQLEDEESDPESMGKIVENDVLLLIPFALFVVFGIFSVVMALTH